MLLVCVHWLQGFEGYIFADCPCAVRVNGQIGNVGHSCDWFTALLVHSVILRFLLECCHLQGAGQGRMLFYAPSFYARDQRLLVGGVVRMVSAPYTLPTSEL